ncbi:FtsX-like permease family protein [Aquimonas voraii]|uniref:Duplicated orphan permease n=1 Tax=Aquimonas voraii TaxID=265719 RepID=A0A1G6WXU9_9GAMM|nr:FtsX-like permease family protein [Aquimonas voraii]SDD69886.1 duplicated orphan permease [Aquimonas voraii]
MSPRRLRLWLNDVRARRRVERELEAELDFHLQARADQLEAQGLDRIEALRRARIELGMLELHRDDVRAARGLRWVDALVNDLRYAARSLMRSPLYTLTAIGVLTLPLTAALLLHAILATYALHSPPIEDLERWVSLEGRSATQHGFTQFNADEAEALLASPPAAFRGLYSVRTLGQPMLVDAHLHKGMGAAVSDNFFELADVGARIGRVFGSGLEADRLGVVLSENGWAQLFGRAPDVVGRSLDIGGHRFAVIGVADRRFNGSHPIAQLYFVRHGDAEALFPTQREDLLFAVSGFLAAEATTERATTQLAGRAAELFAERPEFMRLDHIEVERQFGRLGADDREELLLTSLPPALAVLLMLLIGSANLANLVLARFAARAGELGVRSALGASRGRLLSRLLVECGLIGGAAAVLALGLAALLLAPLHARVFGLIAELGASLVDVRLGWDSAAPALALTLLCTLVFGLLPALAVTRRCSLDGSASQRHLPAHAANRLRSGLMVTQIAASCFLLVVAGLIAANARQALQTPLGYAPERLVGLSAGSDAMALRQRLLELPQVQAIGASSHMPLMSEPLRGAARTVDAEGTARSLSAQIRPIDSQWLRLLDLQVLRGRLPYADESGAVALLSRSAAERLWPGEDPLGRALDLIEKKDVWTQAERGGDDARRDSLESTRRVQVIGIVPDVATGFLFAGGDGPVVYTPARFGDAELGSLLLQLSDTRPETIAAVYRACADTSARSHCAPFRMTDALRIQRLPLIVAAEIAQALGAIAVLITCLGLYGLVAYAVQQRRRELGLRLALGASRARVIGTVMRDARRQIALGLVIGLPLAFALSRVLASLTDRITSFDAIAFVGVPLLLALLAAVAAYLPARASARIDPAESLRAEG